MSRCESGDLPPFRIQKQSRYLASDARFRELTSDTSTLALPPTVIRGASHSLHISECMYVSRTVLDVHCDSV